MIIILWMMRNHKYCCVNYLYYLRHLSNTCRGPARFWNSIANLAFWEPIPKWNLSFCLVNHFNFFRKMLHNMSHSRNHSPCSVTSLRRMILRRVRPDNGIHGMLTISIEQNISKHRYPFFRYSMIQYILCHHPLPTHADGSFQHFQLAGRRPAHRILSGSCFGMSFELVSTCVNQKHVRMLNDIGMNFEWTLNELWMNFE